MKTLILLFSTFNLAMAQMNGYTNSNANGFYFGSSSEDKHASPAPADKDIDTVKGSVGSFVDQYMNTNISELEIMRDTMYTVARLPNYYPHLSIDSSYYPHLYIDSSYEYQYMTIDTIGWTYTTTGEMRNGVLTSRLESIMLLENRLIIYTRDTTLYGKWLPNSRKSEIIFVMQKLSEQMPKAKCKIQNRTRIIDIK